MTGLNTKRLTPRQMRALSALLISASVTDAAKLASISERTMTRYLRDAHFVECYRRGRHSQVEQAVGVMQAAAGQAVAVLIAIATNDKAKTSARVSAAKSLLEQALRSVELENLEARLQALESKVNG